MATAEDIYVAQLFRLRHGLPIWNPEPLPNIGEVQIGDVGHIESGRFYRLFNVTKDRHEEENRGCELPDDFEKLALPAPLNIYDPRAIQAGVLGSKSVSVRDVAVQINVS